MFPGPEDPEADRDFRQGLRDASPETLRAFVALAVLIQVGLFAGSLGVLLVVFRGQQMLGSALVVSGLLVLGLSFVVYRKYKP